MGLISAAQPMPGGMPPEQPQAAPVAPAQPQPGGVDKSAYRRVILASTKIIYEPKTMKAILDLIRKAKTPEAGLAQATVLVMSKLVEASKNAIPQAVRTPAAKGVMALIAELAEKAGIVKNAEQAVKAASQIIAGAIMQAAKINPAQMKRPAQPPAGGMPAQMGA